jgi:hypothetical protein
MLALVMGLAMLLHAQCVNPLDGAETCPSPTPTEITEPEPTEAPTLEPTETPAPTDTPTLVPSDTPTPEPTQTPVPRPPLVVVTETPTPREQRTPRPTPELPTLQTRSRPTLPPGPERARSPACLSAPPPVPDLPGVGDVGWTNEQRCGGTPEALATQHELPALRTPVPASTPERGGALVVVVILPVREPTETPAPERVLPTDEVPAEWPELPVQVPSSSSSSDSASAITWQ